MNIVEKISHVNPNEVKLYKEGVFWVAYEQSAYYVWQKKGYKATRKMVKMLGQEIVSIGFPQSSYETFQHSITAVLEKDEPYFKIFSLEKAIDADAFQRWKAALPFTRELISSQKVKAGTEDTADFLYLFEPEKCAKEELSGRDEICQKLRDFPLESKTPVECMLFLSELKKIVYSNGNL